jgi:hypothetical protein
MSTLTRYTTHKETLSPYMPPIAGYLDTIEGVPVRWFLVNHLAKDASYSYGNCTFPLIPEDLEVAYDGIWRSAVDKLRQDLFLKLKQKCLGYSGVGNLLIFLLRGHVSATVEFLVAEKSDIVNLALREISSDEDSPNVSDYVRITYAVRFVPNDSQIKNEQS